MTTDGEEHKIKTSTLRDGMILEEVLDSWSSFWNRMTLKFMTVKNVERKNEKKKNIVGVVVK